MLPNTKNPLKLHRNPYRKTSAEIVSEAKSMLAGGTRLVSTRRPITPKEPRRQLYGKTGPANRPPSAFSLRYLQFESRALPSTLEPIPSAQSESVRQRSESVDSLIGLQQEHSSTFNNVPKLPSLYLTTQKITASLDNLYEEMPPRKDFKPQTDALNNSPHQSSDVVVSTTSTTTKTTTKTPETITMAKPSCSIVKDHPLKKRQSKSFDENNQQEKNKIKNDKKTKDSILPRKSLTRSNDLIFQSSTETLLEMLKAHSGIKECSDETVSHIHGILSELYTRVKGARGGWRGAVLGALYGLVECTSAKILLAVARVVLALCVTGSNLTGACKLVFKIARNEVNDSLFIDSDVPELLIDGLGRACPLDEPEACIYGYGAVRFLANANVSQSPINIANESKEITVDSPSKQKSLAYRLVRHGAVQLMILHLQMLNEFGAHTKLTGSPLHSLFQLSGALRALAGFPVVTQPIVSRFLFTTTQSNKFPQIREVIEPQDIQLELAGPHLVRAAEVCIGETEVQGNIVRTLSVLSEMDNCCEALSEMAGRLGVLLGPCGETNGFAEKPLGILSRLGYILGNIMARMDTARIQFFNNDVAMEYLLTTLEYYSNQKFTINNQMGDTVIDVLIKMVRVIANMSVNSEVGYGLGIRSPLGSVLLSLLMACNNAEGKMTTEMEELLLATLGALHNLCFYQNIAEGSNIGNTPGTMIDRLADISSALCITLNSGPESAKAESARVLGNMTRSPIARQAFCNSGGLKVLVKCLESEDIELVATTCGVLVNLLGDWERRAPFRELKGPQLLRDVLQRSANDEDWLLCSITCQALWNFLIDSGNVIGALGEDEADYIAGDLTQYLDEEHLFDGNPPDVLWEQFARVATDLLERINASISLTNSPCNSSDDDEIAISEMGDGWSNKFKQWLAD